MLNKTKKVAFLTTGLAGALVVSTAVGVALSSCSTTTTSNSDTSNKYTYAIDWTDQDQLNHLTIDEQGLVYSSARKTEIIAVAPNTAATSFVIPASVKNITGYNEITKNSDGTIATSTSKGAFQNLVSLISVTFASDNSLVSIGDSSFSGCTYLSTISLPSSTSVVYNNAFLNCANLRSINLSGVAYIGSAAFKGAMANGIGVNLDLSNASYIGDEAFSGSSSLVGVDFSKNTELSYIGKSAFANAFSSGDNAATLDLSNTKNLKTISDNAFLNCTKLGSVVLPTNSVLTTIGANAFSGATSLTQVGSTANTFTAPSSLGNYVLTTVSSSNTSSYVSSGIGANAFTGTKIATIDLSAVTSATTPFGAASFKGMTSLTSVNFGSSSKITTIPYSLFEGDTALASLTLPTSITSIADGGSTATTRSPFYGCTGLKTVDMSAITSYAPVGTTKWFGVTIDNTTAVPAGLFQGLTALTTVALKKGTVVIGSNAFNGASALTSVKEGSISTIADTTDGLVIPSTLQMINTSAFEGTGIKTVAFANTATSASNGLWFIGKDAFKNATALTSVDLTTTDKTNEHSILPAAFYDDGSTSTSTKIIGFAGVSSRTFSGASALTTVKLPSSVKNIYTSAFVGNTALTSVNFSELTDLLTIDSTNFTGANAFKEIDLSANSKLTNVATAASIFTGLPEAAIVKLPSITTNLNTTSFLTGTNTTASTSARPMISYPNGLNITAGSLAISGTNYKLIGVTRRSDSTPPNAMLQYVSGDFNLASDTNNQDIRLYFPLSFFGNTKLEKLTLSAKSLYTPASSSGGNPTQQELLFIHNSAGNAIDASRYDSTYLPLGGNSSLTNLVFTGFDLNNSPTWPQINSANDTSNSLYRTTKVTWAQVSTIINKFASNTTNTPTVWTAGQNNAAPNSNTKINFDSVASGTPNTAENGNYTVGFTNSQDKVDSTTYSSTATIPNTIKAGTNATKSFIHNGVTWTLNVTSGGAITLVGTDINVYKVSRSDSSSGSNHYQICFNQGSNGTPSKISVTLEIYNPSK